MFSGQNGKLIFLTQLFQNLNFLNIYVCTCVRVCVLSITDKSEKTNEGWSYVADNS